MVLELTPRGAGLADEYYAERTAPLPGGNLLAEVRFGSTDWVPMLMARHGGDARVVAPAGLAADAARWLAAALESYGAAGHPPAPAHQRRQRG